jgi:hypothetical protein
MRVVLALLAAATAVPAAAQRLPGGVTPEHYTLWFAPDLDKATFRGRAEIRVRLDVPASAVTLHAAEITCRSGWRPARPRSASPIPAFSTTSCAASI